MADVEILLFGPPRALRDSAQLRFDTRKALALLAYLAVTEQPHGRDTLTGLLWPELPRTNARAALRRTISVATAIGPALAVDGDAVGLRAGSFSCDVVDFRRLVEAGTDAAATDAVALAAGRFLEGFVLRDSPEFDDWRFTVEQSLHDRLSAALRRLSAQAVREGDLDTALAFARRRTDIEPLSEPAHADLMLVTAWSGDRPGAMRVYQDLVRRLDHALGVAPVPSTRALYHAIRTGSTPPAPTVAARAVSHPDVSGSEVTRQLVAASAVIGAPADPELLRLVSGRDETEVAAALAGGVLIGEGTPVRYRTADPHAAAEALADLSLARRRLLHGRVAEALARRASTDPTAVGAEVIGEHFADAGRDPEAAEWFVRAAETASARGDHPAALDAWRSSLAVGRDAVDVQLSLATTLVRLGRYGEALVALGRAAELRSDDGSALDRARAALALAESDGDLPRVATFSSHLADLLFAAGHDDQARSAQRRWAEVLAQLERGEGAADLWTFSEW